MSNELNKCEKCGSARNVGQYKFYYGRVTSSPGGRRLWFDKHPGTQSAPYVRQSIEGNKEVWICNECINRECTAKSKSNISAFIIIALLDFFLGSILYYFWIPISTFLKRVESNSCCACFLVITIGIIAIWLIILPFIFLTLAFTKKDKEETGDQIAIKMYKSTIEKSASWINSKATIINGFVMEPRRVMGFWTRKQKETEKFS